MFYNCFEISNTILILIILLLNYNILKKKKKSFFLKQTCITTFFTMTKFNNNLNDTIDNINFKDF